jgi:hypothetical protein
MPGQDDDDVGPVQQRVQLRALVHVPALVAEPGHVRVVIADPRAARGKARDHRGRGRVAIILDIGLERHPDHPDTGAIQGELTLVEAVGDKVDHVAGHREVDVRGKLDEAIEVVEGPRPPRQVVRVHGDAVAADARAGREPHEPEGLGGGGVDDLPDVEAHPLAEQRQVVDEGDVDVAEHVLEQLGHLRGVGG